MRYIWALMVARRARVPKQDVPAYSLPPPVCTDPRSPGNTTPLVREGDTRPSEPDLVRSKSGYGTPEGFLAGFRAMLYQYESTKSMTYAGHRCVDAPAVSAALSASARHGSKGQGLPALA